MSFSYLQSKIDDKHKDLQKEQTFKDIASLCNSLTTSARA